MNLFIVCPVSEYGFGRILSGCCGRHCIAATSVTNAWSSVIQRPLPHRRNPDAQTFQPAGLPFLLAGFYASGNPFSVVCGEVFSFRYFKPKWTYVRSTKQWLVGLRRIRMKTLCWLFGPDFGWCYVWPVWHSGHKKHTMQDHRKVYLKWFSLLMMTPFVDASYT